MRKHMKFVPRGSGDTSASGTPAAQGAVSTAFGTKIERLFVEYRVSLGSILQLQGQSDSGITQTPTLTQATDRK
jgi:hypothetical protein